MKKDSWLMDRCHDPGDEATDSRAIYRGSAERRMTGKLSRRGPVFIEDRRYRLYSMLVFILLASLSTLPLSSAATDSPALMKLISANEDTRMSAEDLAFFLVTHDFDANPKKDYVEVRLDGVVYKVVPNGSKSGLADITIMP